MVHSDTVISTEDALKLLQSGQHIQFQIQGAETQMQQIQQQNSDQLQQLQQIQATTQKQPVFNYEQVHNVQPVHSNIEYQYATETPVYVNTSGAGSLSIEQRLEKVEKGLAENTECIKAQSEVLNQILKHTSRFEKYISKILKDEDENLTVPIPIHQIDPNEMFDDLEEMEKIRTVDELQSFEQKLADSSYRDRLIRFFRTKYTLNGHQNGANIFKEILRLLVAEASLFKTFSWAGQKRNGVQHASFKQNHSVFVRFMKNVTLMSDVSMTADRVDGLFEKTLRFKNVLEKRDAQRVLPMKKFAERNRPRKSAKISDEQKNDEVKQDENQNKDDNNGDDDKNENDVALKDKIGSTDFDVSKPDDTELTKMAKHILGDN